MSRREHRREWPSSVGVVIAGVVAVAAVVGASLLPLQARSVAVARAEQRDAAAELVDAEGRRDVRHRLLVRAQAALDRERWQLAVNAADAVATTRRTDGHLLHRQLEELVLGETQRELATTGESLEWTRAVLGLQEHAMAPLRECLTGVRRANASLAGGDGAGAAEALDLVAPACLRVRAGTEPPAFPYDFPDPHVVRDGDRWWGYATNSNAGAVQLVSSSDLTTWRLEGNALAGLPDWAVPGATWAPAVVRHGGRWLLYYTVRERGSGVQCISVATSASTGGPFRDRSSEPVVCERAAGGSIDPDPVVDRDGRLHLLWKTELDTLGAPAELRGAPVSDGGTAVTDPPATLLRAETDWEGRTIEGPAMVVADGYHLLYSGGSWNSAGYAVGSARCETILGPCSRQSDQPVLRSFDEVKGPGGISTFATDHGHGVAYHAWHGDAVRYPATRYLHVGRLEITNRTAVVHP